MPVKIRLSRFGNKHRPFFRIIVADARSPRDGRFIEKIGHYNPLLPKESIDRVVVELERFEHWLGVGAVPTKVVKRLIDNIKNKASMITSVTES